MKSIFVISGIFASLLLGGCVATVGSKPADVSPRLIKNYTVGHPQGVVWDRPGAFGSVPANLQQRGNAECQAVKYSKAIGYHPKVIGLNGQLIPGGGFFCIR